MRGIQFHDPVQAFGPGIRHSREHGADQFLLRAIVKTCGSRSFTRPGFSCTPRYVCLAEVAGTMVIVGLGFGWWPPN